MKLLFAACLALFLSATAGDAFAKPGGSSKGSSSRGPVSVKGHTNKSGSYVSSHKRTAPDKSKANNYSTKGNVNPYTGKKGTKDPYKK